MLTLTLARWAALKAIGWSGVGRWLAARTGGALTGSTAWAVVAVCGVIGLLIAWRMWDPPQRVYTAAEIRADRLEKELQAKDAALAEARRTLDTVQQMFGRAAERINELGDENAELRKAAPKGGTTVLRDDDQWLRRKRARAGGG